MTTRSRWSDEPDAPPEAEDFRAAFEPPPPLDPAVLQAVAGRLDARLAARGRARFIAAALVLGVAAAVLLAALASRPEADQVAREQLRPEPIAPALPTRGPQGTPGDAQLDPLEMRGLGHRLPVAAVDASTEENTAPLEAARVCLRRGDNACTIAALEGRANDPVSLSLLAETYRVVGDVPGAMRAMRRLVQLFPEDRRASRYREYLYAHGQGDAGEQPQGQPPSNPSTRVERPRTLERARPAEDVPVEPVEPARPEQPTSFTSETVRRVVAANRQSLQECYDQAIRGEAAPPSMRLEITLRVSASGRVTRAEVSGGDWHDVGDCLEQAIREWDFPASQEGGQTAFPVVFAGGM
ncbi:MAG: AgmX/PglI C-terminal domain-containing protein [Deltaproteobacteria bacterium]|nr:AgmX/PglI C-terminal domain-containing protein [Deltaproteobacteria bacterium]